MIVDALGSTSTNRPIYGSIKQRLKKKLSLYNTFINSFNVLSVVLASEYSLLEQLAYGDRRFRAMGLQKSQWLPKPLSKK